MQIKSPHDLHQKHDFLAPCQQPGELPEAENFPSLPRAGSGALELLVAAAPAAAGRRPGERPWHLQQGIQALAGRSCHPMTLSGVRKTHITRSLERQLISSVLFLQTSGGPSTMSTLSCQRPGSFSYVLGPGRWRAEASVLFTQDGGPSPGQPSPSTQASVGRPRC